MVTESITPKNDAMMYQRLLNEYRWAEEACEAGDGDFDVLWMRWEAARLALNLFIRSARQDDAPLDPLAS